MKFQEFINPLEGTHDLDPKSDEVMFNKMLNFIISLDPEQLTDNQLEEISNMLEDLEFEDEDLTEIKMSGKTSQEKRRYQARYYRRFRSKISQKRKKFRKSAEGRKRKKQSERMEKVGKTPTGKARVRYHR